MIDKTPIINTEFILTPLGRVLLEKLVVSHLVKVSFTLCGSTKFITAFTTAQKLSLSWARSIQSPPHFISSRSILMLSSYLCPGIPSGLLLSGFPTKPLSVPFLKNKMCSLWSPIWLSPFVSSGLFELLFGRFRRRYVLLLSTELMLLLFSCGTFYLLMHAVCELHASWLKYEPITNPITSQNDLQRRQTGVTVLTGLEGEMRHSSNYT